MSSEPADSTTCDTVFRKAIIPYTFFRLFPIVRNPIVLAMEFRKKPDQRELHESWEVTQPSKYT